MPDPAAGTVVVPDATTPAVVVPDATAAVTVVVPTHDRPELLVRALRSVLAQTAAPASVIVVDDTGTARAVVDGFDGRVRYERARPGTAGASRNLGAALAGTPLLAFLDDGDTWHPTFLARCAGALAGASTADFAAAWTWRCRGGHRRPGGSLPADVAAAGCLHRNPGLTGSNFVMRAEAFRRLGGFDETLPVNDDLDLFVRALDAGIRYAVVPDRLVVQYRHGGGHQSSLGAVRASGLAGYRDKYRDRLTVAQRRSLRRERYAALRLPDQTRRRRLGYALLGWLNTTPRQYAEVVRHRLSGAALYE